jgi:crotonobetainyl-CoA:carnitine CoA-transferase CaiB-like acyl-CoA transferase
MNAPLASYCVVDLTRVLAGPYCTMQLGDLGARVIKVEPPDGDDTRAWGPFAGGESTYFMSINRNKRSITLDLKQEAGKQILWRLLERADVVVENFRPGTMERLGFGFAAVSARLPRLVCCSISGFGQSGPDRDLPGYDVLIQGEAGLMSLTGEEGGPPYKLGVSIADLSAGMAAVEGILAALLARERSGSGQLVDISMLEVAASLLTFQAGSYFASGRVPRRLGNSHPSIVPYAPFPCADGTLIVAAGNDGLFARLCQALGQPALARDPRFATAAARVEHRDELDPLIAAALAARPRAEWIALLRQAGVPCGAVRDVAEVAGSAQLAARGALLELAHPRAGALRMFGSPLRLGAAAQQAALPPPTIGQHSEEILRWLGCDAEEIAALRLGRVV